LEVLFVAEPGGSKNVFDRFVVGLTVMGALIAVTALVGVLRRPGAAASGSAETILANIELSDFAITGDLAVPQGPLTLQVTNRGATFHNLGVGEQRTEDLASGSSERLELGALEAGTYEIFCSIPGHREAGMVADLVVGGAGAAGAEGDEEIDYAAMSKAMNDSIALFPAPTEGRGNQPLEPEILDDGTKRFDIVTSIIPWEVAPGTFVDAWTYNGQVPGPVIKVEVGDKVQVVIDNQLPMGTDVHFHGVSLPNNMDGVAPVTQPLIEPGQTFTYEFVAEKPAIAMYHAHHHAQMQVPNGLFGTIFIGDVALPEGLIVSGVEIPDDLTIAAEIPMVLNDAGVIGFSLNGKSFPATDPYVQKVGDWVLIHYFNEGLQIHPMHPHQFPQLVFAKDGIPLDSPYWADTLNVAPGERYSVLMHLDREGVWVWHCHILNHVEREKGMFGMVTAFVVQP
jgi:hypothetical protein